MEEEKEAGVSRFTVTNNEALDTFQLAPRTETLKPTNEPKVTATTTPASIPTTAPPPGFTAVSTTDTKKKRGRPRKYEADGKRSLTLALSPMPISSSIPLTGEFPNWKRDNDMSLAIIKKPQRFEFENPGQKLAYSVGANFTPHVITVNAGEDITMKIMSLSQQESRAICILSANGTISNVTLRQATSSGGTLTYEGCFEILTLTGSFMPTQNGATKSRCGGMSVSLAGQDGRVVGGGLAGLLVAAGPVQVVVGSFLPGHQQEQKPKKPRNEATTIFFPPINTISGEEMKAAYTGGIKPIVTTPSNQEHKPPSPSAVTPFKISSTDNLPLSEQEPKTQSQSNCEVSC
ncbi:AT-hook motif nuclear-localized protein 6-like [Cucurbita moschata]|uniref:AT-hook motif nuclear-localized protein n=1 Tax=Cucurbita moschata TaxID=3662 RepID=A0A6J1G063_CUCMO|nr:AT-hook motif nuclear-localized protein 6-like [Cucurbita moschata]